MDNNSHMQAANPQDTAPEKRRSTRIEFVTTLLIAGRDGSGTPFREYTQTAVVNLHGCKVRTSYRIEVGMLVNLECPKAGTWGKGVCVRVWNSPPGIPGHEIAIELVKPQNLWGVTNPPADWEKVAQALAQGLAPSAESPAPNAAPSEVAAHAPADFSPPSTAAPPSTPAPDWPTVPPDEQQEPLLVTGPEVLPPPSILPVTISSVDPPEVSAVLPSFIAEPLMEQRLAELERCSDQLVASVLDILRGKAEDHTRRSLEEFRKQMEALTQDAVTRARLSLQQSYEEHAGSLIGLRTDLMEQMASRGAQLIQSTEDALRARLQANRAKLEGTRAGNLAEPVVKK